MAMSSIDELGIPLMRGNPFSLRPIEAEDAEALIGRRDILREWNEHIRSNSPRLIALYGERGSGRTSLLQAAATWTPHSHHAHIWPDSDVVATVLTELFVSFADFEAPHSTELIGSRLVEMLARIEGPLPLIAFDHPSAQGSELAGMLLRILPILHRLRALCIVTVTPAQYSTWSNEVRDAFDISGPLAPFTGQEVASLIENRFRSVSTNGWRPDSSFISAVLHRTGGQPAAVIRLLRDIVDIARGVRTTPIESFFDIDRESGLLSTEHEILTSIPENIEALVESEDDVERGLFNSEQSILQPLPHLRLEGKSGQSLSKGQGLGSRSDSIVEHAASSPDFRDPWDPVDVAGRPIQSSRINSDSRNTDIAQSHTFGQTAAGPNVVSREGAKSNRLSQRNVSSYSESDSNRLTAESNTLSDSIDPSDSSIGIDRGEEDWQSRVFGEDDEKPIYLEEQSGKTESVDPDDVFSPFAEWGDDKERSSNGGFKDGENHEFRSDDDTSAMMDVQISAESSDSEVNSGSVTSQHKSLEQTVNSAESSLSEGHSEQPNSNLDSGGRVEPLEGHIQESQNSGLDINSNLKEASADGSNESLDLHREIDIDGAEAGEAQLGGVTSAGISTDIETNDETDSGKISDNITPRSDITGEAIDSDSLAKSLGPKVETSQQNVHAHLPQASDDAGNRSLFQSQAIGRSSIGGGFSALADRSRGNIFSRDVAISSATDKVTKTRMRPTGPIQAKPDLDVPNATLEKSPVHVFDGGALWVDEASRGKFESLSNSDSKEINGEKTNQAFTLPPSTTADSDPEDNVDSTSNPTFYRSQDGTSLLEIQDGCTPPSLRRNDSSKPLDAVSHDTASPDTNPADAVAPVAAPQYVTTLDGKLETTGRIEDRRSESSLDAEFTRSDDYQSQRPESFDADSDYGPINFESSEQIDEEIDNEFAGRRRHIQPTRERVQAGISTFGDLKSRLKGLREPRWEPDLSLDHLRLRALSNHEILVIEAAVSREISPSDQRLQARLQVGRSRLSQIYNGLYRAGILSARKEGRLRYFKLSSRAINHLEGAV